MEIIQCPTKYHILCITKYLYNTEYILHYYSTVAAYPTCIHLLEAFSHGAVSPKGCYSILCLFA